MSVINNFFPRARLDYFTTPQGQETEPKLPPKLAGPLHKIIMTTNLNPVKVIGSSSPRPYSSGAAAHSALSTTVAYQTGITHNIE